MRDFFKLTAVSLLFTHLSVAQPSNNFSPEALPTETTVVSELYSQSTTMNDIKRFSIGIKIGIPNLVSGGIQYTLPILDNHLAPHFDYSKYGNTIDDVEVSLKFTEFGISYFFNNEGKGLYAGVGFSGLELEGKYEDIDLIEGRKGSGSGSVSISTTNLRLGLKTGGTVYFRIEAGYGIGDIPQKIEFTAKDDANPSYTEKVEEEIPNIPGFSDSGLIVANIGFGVSF